MAIREEIFELLRTDPGFREDMRRQLLTDELLGLPAQVSRQGDQIERQGEQIERLAVQVQRQGDQIERQGEQIERQGEQIERLAVQVGRQGEQIERLATQVQRQGDQIERQGEQMVRLAQQVQDLVSWQRGESGRRNGERYERETLRRAPALFNGGEGGSPEHPWVQQRLTQQLGALLGQGVLTPEEDPYLTDLVWWKGDRLAVVEVSVQVNGDDVRRAASRAATLRQAGATAFGVVIGEDWAVWEARDRALTVGVEWKVGPDLSAGFLAFRRGPVA